jgi:hypothetical protein
VQYILRARKLRRVMRSYSAIFFANHASFLPK